MGVILSTLGGGSRIKWVNMYRTFLARPGTYKQRPQGRKEPRASSGKSKCIRKSETRDVQEEVKNGAADADKGELAKGPFKLYEGMWTLSRRTWKPLKHFEQTCISERSCSISCENLHPESSGGNRQGRFLEAESMKHVTW